MTAVLPNRSLMLSNCPAAVFESLEMGLRTAHTQPAATTDQNQRTFSWWVSKYVMARSPFLRIPASSNCAALAYVRLCKHTANRSTSFALTLARAYSSGYDSLIGASAMPLSRKEMPFSGAEIAASLKSSRMCEACGGCGDCFDRASYSWIVIVTLSSDAAIFRGLGIAVPGRDLR